MSDLTYRFNEIMTAVSLSGDTVTQTTDEVLPNLTRDLHEPELFGAIMCQTFKRPRHEIDDFATRLGHLCINSVHKKAENLDMPTEDDIFALILAEHLAWAIGDPTLLFNSIGILGQLCNALEIPIPEVAFAIFKGNSTVDRFGNLDPYKILNKEYDMKEMFMTTKPEVSEEEIDAILQQLKDMGHDVD